MAFLIRWSLLLILILSTAPLIHAEDTSLYYNQRPLLDYVFSGYLQGRVSGILWHPEFIPGDLSTAPPPQQAGGEKSSMASLHRVRFSLSTPLPFLDNFRLHASSKVDGKHAKFEDLYADFRPDPEWIIRLGLTKVPLGSELQQSSSKMDTVEHPLIYDFGNFGWAGTLGMAMASSRSLGLRLDRTWEKTWSGSTPFVQAGLFSGNGRNTFDSTPMQAMLRLGLSWKTAADVIQFRNGTRYDEAIPYELRLGFSGAYGNNKFDTRSWEYIPIGIDGNVSTHEEDLITMDTWDRYENVTTLGGDCKVVLDNLILKAEWTGRRFSDYTSQGYFITLLYRLDRMTLQDLDWVMRWEEARQGYADGVHIPHRPYQAATLGFNWQPEAQSEMIFWRVQLNYIMLYLDGKPHSFHGSDLLIGQLQVSF